MVRACLYSSLNDGGTRGEGGRGAGNTVGGREGGRERPEASPKNSV